MQDLIPCSGNRTYPVLLRGTPLRLYLRLRLKLPCFLIGNTLLLKPAHRCYGNGEAMISYLPSRTRVLTA